MRRKKFIKHQVQYHLLNMKKVIFFEKDNNKTWIEYSEKCSEYYTCKECENEVNQKGHLMKHQYTSMSEPKEGPRIAGKLKVN